MLSPLYINHLGDSIFFIIILPYPIRRIKPIVNEPGLYGSEIHSLAGEEQVPELDGRSYKDAGGSLRGGMAGAG